MLNKIKANQTEIVACVIGVVVFLVVVAIMTMMVNLGNHMDCVADNIAAGERVCSR